MDDRSLQFVVEMTDEEQRAFLLDAFLKLKPVEVLALIVSSCEKIIERNEYIHDPKPVKNALRDLWIKYPDMMETIKECHEDVEKYLTPK